MDLEKGGKMAPGVFFLVRESEFKVPINVGSWN